MINSGSSKLLLIALLLSVLLALSSCSNSQSPKDDNGDPQNFQPTVLLISLDGFRHDYFSMAATPNLDRLIRDGVKAESLKPVFPTLTFPNHYSAVTGLYPENHGIVANSMLDKDFNETYSIGKAEAVTDGRWYGGEPLWVTAEKQGQKAACYFWVASEAEIKGTRPSYFTKYDGSVSYTDRINQVLGWLDMSDAKRPTFLTLYLSAIDGAGHTNGPNSQALKNAVEDVDANIGELIAGLESRNLMDKVDIVIISDHGMTEISQNRVLLLDDYFDLNDASYISWSPMVMIQPRSGKEDEIYNKLRNASSHMRVYRSSEVPEDLHFRNHKRILPIILIAADEWSITSRDYFESRKSRFDGGNHGYDNRDAAMQAIFIAHGPSFKEGATVPPLNMVDIYPLVTNILGLTPAQIDGSLDNIKIVLREKN